MRISTLKNLSAIPTSFSWMAKHRGLVVGLSAFWALLMTLAPLVQMHAGIPPNLVFTSIVNMAFTLPIDFFLLPMLVAYVDAEFNQHPANPLQDWRKTFEVRWLKAAGARVLLYVLSTLGLMAFFIPGLVVILLLGWMPVYTLLRGGTIAHAARWSTKIMTQEWRRVILAILPIFAIYLGLLLCLDLALVHWGPEPTLWLRFRHPYFWLASMISAAVNIWLSLALLAIFHRVENEAMLKSQDPDQSRK